MNVFAKFDEILSLILQDIKETKRYGRTVGLSFGVMVNIENDVRIRRPQHICKKQVLS